MRILIALSACLVSACASLSIPGTSTTPSLFVSGVNTAMYVVAAKNGVATGNCSATVVAPDVGKACAPVPPDTKDAAAQAALVACIQADLQSQLAGILARQLAAICAKPTVAAAPVSVAPPPAKP